MYDINFELKVTVTFNNKFQLGAKINKQIFGINLWYDSRKRCWQDNLYLQAIVLKIIKMTKVPKFDIE